MPPSPPPPPPPASAPRPGDDALRLLAEQSVAAIRGEPLPAGGDPRTARRVVGVIRAIEAARQPGRASGDEAGAEA